jgi:hypothetical protein
MWVALEEHQDGTLTFVQSAQVDFFLHGWRTHHRTTYTGTAQRVPEPHPISALLCGLATVVALRRHRLAHSVKGRA